MQGRCMEGGGDLCALLSLYAAALEHGEIILQPTCKERDLLWDPHSVECKCSQIQIKFKI